MQASEHSQAGLAYPVDECSLACMRGLQCVEPLLEVRCIAPRGQISEIDESLQRLVVALRFHGRDEAVHLRPEHCPLARQLIEMLRPGVRGSALTLSLFLSGFFRGDTLSLLR